MGDKQPFQPIGQRLEELRKLSQNEQEKDRQKALQEERNEQERIERERKAEIKRIEESKRETISRKKHQTDSVTGKLLAVYIIGLIVVPLIIDTKMAVVYALIIAIPGFIAIGLIGEFIKKFLD